MDDRIYTPLYVEQLKTALGDILAVSKPRWPFRNLWDQRVKRARYLLQQRRAFSAGEKP